MGPPEPPERLEVVGLLREPAFHVAKGTAEALKLKFPRKFADPIVRPMFEFAWHEYLQEKKKVTLSFAQEVADPGCVGRSRPRPPLQAATSTLWRGCFPPRLVSKGDRWAVTSRRLLFCFKQHVFVYLDITIQEQPIGTLLFELFSDVCPKTCENFRVLCTGGITSPSSGLHLTYKNSVFHRVVTNGWIQGGGASGRGDGGESIYGPTFEDENFAIRHSKRGILGMANKGRHSNGSQFYITLQPAPYLDKKHVAFGQLIEGTETLQKLEAVSTYNERPVEECKIVNCGVFEP
ncbi:PPIL6 protein, partial [Nothocercus nigrocapillus]|nr:PPIL6 protein [Nothocercus nigrocapillus]